MNKQHLQYARQEIGALFNNVDVSYVQHSTPQINTLPIITPAIKLVLGQAGQAYINYINLAAAKALHEELGKLLDLE